MRVESNSVGKFIIVRGKEPRATAFSFFVADDRASWTSRGFFAKQYGTKEEAEKDVLELRRRKKLKLARFHGAVAESAAHAAGVVEKKEQIGG